MYAGTVRGVAGGARAGDGQRVGFGRHAGGKRSNGGCGRQADGMMILGCYPTFIFVDLFQKIRGGLTVFRRIIVLLMSLEEKDLPARSGRLRNIKCQRIIIRLTTF